MTKKVKQGWALKELERVAAEVKRLGAWVQQSAGKS